MDRLFRFAKCWWILLLVVGSSATAQPGWERLPWPGGTAGSVFALNKDTAFVFGQRNTNFLVNRTTDGGETWTSLIDCDECLWNFDYQYVRGTGMFISAAVPNGSRIYLLNETTGHLSRIQGDSQFVWGCHLSFLDSAQGFVMPATDDIESGAVIYHTNNGGISWRRIELNIGELD